MSPFVSAPSGITRVLRGNRYPWTASVIGDDIVVTGQAATWFGGSHDPEDDGTTASGVSTKANPHFFGCALPLDLGRPHDNPCAGSPLPRIPWFTKVMVTNRANAQIIQVALIDLGPSAPPEATAAIDLTQAAFLALGGTIEQGRLLVDFRILGGALLMGQQGVQS